jgi:hypothetical protein
MPRAFGMDADGSVMTRLNTRWWAGIGSRRLSGDSSPLDKHTWRREKSIDIIPRQTSQRFIGDAYDGCHSTRRGSIVTARGSCYAKHLEKAFRAWHHVTSFTVSFKLPWFRYVRRNPLQKALHDRHAAELMCGAWEHYRITP